MWRARASRAAAAKRASVVPLPPWCRTVRGRRDESVPPGVQCHGAFSDARGSTCERYRRNTRASRRRRCPARRYRESIYVPSRFRGFASPSARRGSAHLSDETFNATGRRCPPATRTPLVQRRPADDQSTGSSHGARSSASHRGCRFAQDTSMGDGFWVPPGRSSSWSMANK